MAEESHSYGPQNIEKTDKTRTRDEKIALAKQIIEESQTTKLSYEKLAAKYGFHPKTLGYWVGIVHKMNKAPKPEKKAQVPAVVSPKQDTKELEQQVATLQEQLREEKAKNKALMNVVVILGHQHSEDE
ncbi:hypothetical protein [Rhizobium phage RHph_X2_28B]|uniref:hypothetical protein n=1 Tax=Rhizobium phage RHph_X2_28B TaxID=2836086 RepID=UPI0023293B60|nr:hypothetical protein PP751_gp015 [Rhizobium phage RHph_X2_28B]QWY83467.1 hypothetical protein [Rhizobium phage RHph_X2_28B]QWY83703.1 hypothetical protein [Rhizobium phage RHph_X3_15]